MMKLACNHMFLWAFACLLSQTSTAQELPTHLLDNMNVRNIGPAVTSGRVTAIDAVDKDGGAIYIGAASGGVWKSESGGVSWTPIFDNEKVIGIGAVKIAPSNNDVVWVGTGEGNPRNSQTSGKGIYRSQDAGLHWQLMGLEETKVIHRICIHPTNEQIVFAGAGGSPWGPNPERGVYKTNDGGSTWQKSLFVNDSVGCADLVMDPQNPNKLFAAMWQYQRKPYSFNSGGAGSGLYRTVDSGNTWIRISEKDGLPKGILGRIGVAIAPSNPKVVYAMIEAEKTGLYKSTDGGFKWQLVTEEHVNDRPFYYHEFYVDPSNENHLIYLHSTVSESIDGGKTWTTLLPYWGVHPDHHAMWWSKSNPKFILEGNDGGMNISHDGGRNWRFIENLPLGQFYHINYDMEIPYNVYGGMQDNGSWKGPGYAWHQGGIVEADWNEVLFGDGFDVVPRIDNARFIYAMSQGGEVMHIDTQTGNTYYCKPTTQDSVKLRFNWNSAIFENEKGLYFGSQFLHFSTDHGKSWSAISPDLTSNNPDKLIAHKSGGLTIDATNAENYCTIISIAAQEDVIWVGTDDGHLQLSKDHGKSWQLISSKIKGFPKNAWIANIIIGATIDEVFVVVNNYRQNDWQPYLFHSLDGGKTWKNVALDKNVEGHCLSIVQDINEPNLLFLGTEHGLYLSLNRGQKWHKWESNFPSVATQDLKIHPREGDLIIGTFGRAAYIIDDIEPLRKLANSHDVFSKKPLIAVASQEAYEAMFMRPDGKRFPADGEFAGNNKPGGAALRYYFNMPSEKPKDKLEVKVSILNEKNDTVRWFIHEPDSGLNVIRWYGDSNGFTWPSRKDREESKSPDGGGYTVAPGKYKVTFQWKEFTDSTYAVYSADPRLEWNTANYELGKKQFAEFEKGMKEVSRMTEAMRMMRQGMDVAGASWKLSVDTLKRSLLAQGDSLKMELKVLEDEIYGEEGLSGIRDNSHTLMSKWYDSMGYMANGYVGVSAGFDDAVATAMKQQLLIKEKLNNVILNKWNPWLESADQIQTVFGKPIQSLD